MSMYRPQESLGEKPARDVYTLYGLLGSERIDYNELFVAILDWIVEHGAQKTPKTTLNAHADLKDPVHTCKKRHGSISWRFDGRVEITLPCYTPDQHLAPDCPETAVGIATTEDAALRACLRAAEIIGFLSHGDVLLKYLGSTTVVDAGPDCPGCCVSCSLSIEDGQLRIEFP